MQKDALLYELDKQILTRPIGIRITGKSKRHASAGVRSESVASAPSTNTLAPGQHPWKLQQGTALIMTTRFFPPCKETSPRNNHAFSPSSKSTQAAFFLVYFRLEITLSDKSLVNKSRHIHPIRLLHSLVLN